jgi:predicted DCC family thiol-disulfide oxidoreductase YuxK
LFYDSDCGLCHRAVRFALAEDRRGDAFLYAPLRGETFLERTSEQQRLDLPDSVVVITSGGRVLTRSGATLEIMSRLGGCWRVLAAVGRAVPRRLRDGVYETIARHRKRLFGSAVEDCPVADEKLRRRFRL